MAEIQTDRLRLRPWKDEDLDAYARICADPAVMCYMTGGGDAAFTREQSEEQVARFVGRWEEHGVGIWAVEVRSSGDFIGRTGLMRHDDWPEGEHKTEVGWLLDREVWGRGLATEGARASLRYGFEELGLERIISIIQPANRASRRVAEKAGLTLRGETRWRGNDVIWYAMDRQDWSVKPATEAYCLNPKPSSALPPVPGASLL